MPEPNPWDPAQRNGTQMLEQTLNQWMAQGPEPDLWIFAYASLVWRPEFKAAEQRLARVHGHHRSLQMWSRINRGTFECPGLVFAMVSGGSCTGLALRVPHAEVRSLMPKLWAREMPHPVYDPKWLTCQTAQGPVRALAFTLSRRSPSYTGELPAERYQDIFQRSCGRYGTTLDYAHQTYEGLLRHGIHDRKLQQLLLLANKGV
jgi:cation transport protein ChaC